MSPNGRVPAAALATLTREPTFREGWVYERKLDGERCLAVRSGAEVRLYTRSGRDVTVSFPEVAEAVRECTGHDLVLDGEIVAFEGDRTSFAALQPRIGVTSAQRARATGVRVFYYVFDILEEAGEDLRPEPLHRRKKALRAALAFRDPLRYVQHRVRADESTLAQACARGWEGLIAKRFDAPYRSGRTKEWLKFKCEAGQELVIVGFTDPEGSRAGFGALLLGYYDGVKLVYAGKVGTGFSDRVLRDLRARMDELEIDESACDRGKLPTRGVHWLRPELVAQVAFTEWTTAGQLRHPRYVGLRRDKAAKNVVRE